MNESSFSIGINKILRFLLYFRLKDTDGPKTQFVVTLDSLGFPTKKPTVQKGSTVSELKRTKPTSYKADERKKTPIHNRIGRRPQDNENGPERRLAEDNRNKSPPTLKRKRTPIKFDINDEAVESKDPEPEKKRRSKSSDRNNERDRKSTDRKSTDRDENRKRDSRSNERESGESNSKMRTLKTNSQNKYDNLPPCKYWMQMEFLSTVYFK